MKKTNCAFGIAFHSTTSVLKLLPKYEKKVVIINQPSTKYDPVYAYESIKEEDRLRTVFFVTGMEALQYIIYKFGNNLQGRFFLFESIENIKKAKAVLVDGSKDAGIVKRLELTSELDYLLDGAKKITKFSKKSLTERESTELLTLISNLDKRALKEKKFFTKTLQEILRLINEEIKHKVNVKKYEEIEKQVNEVAIQCVTNHAPYDTITKFEVKDGKKIIEVGSAAGKTMLKKFAMTTAGVRTIRAFQDIVYFLTPMDQAIEDHVADPFGLSTMLQWWNPKPKEAKKIHFTCNKKPLPKGLKSKKKFKKWKNQKHIIPPSLIKKRKGNVNTRHKDNVPPIPAIVPTPIKAGLISLETLIKRLELPESKYKVYGVGRKEGKLVLKSKMLVSVIDAKSKKMHYAEVE